MWLSESTKTAKSVHTHLFLTALSFDLFLAFLCNSSLSDDPLDFKLVSTPERTPLLLEFNFGVHEVLDFVFSFMNLTSLLLLPNFAEDDWLTLTLELCLSVL